MPSRRFYSVLEKRKKPMPKLSLPVLETENGFVRPVVMEIVRKLMSITNIAESTDIYFPSDMEKVAKFGSTLTEDNLPNPTTGRQRITIVVREEYKEDFLSSTVVNYPDAPFFWADPLLNMAIKPVYVDTEYTLTLKYRARDKVTAQRWRDDQRTKIGIMREQFIHEATYSYIVPPAFMAIAAEVHELREKVAPYGDTFAQYFDAHASPRMTDLVTQAGTAQTKAVRETTERIVGYFDFTGQPEEGEKDSEGPTWTISFDYKFRIQKPVECHLSYPLVVHQQLIKYRPDRADNQPKREVGMTLSMRAQHAFEATNDIDQYYTGKRGLTIPVYDEFEPDFEQPNTMRVLDLLVAVETDPTAADPYLLCNLATDVRGYAFHPAIVRFLKAERTYMGSLMKSVFNLTLYRNGDALDHPCLTVDEDLNVRLVNLQSYREVYHLRLSLYVDWWKIDPEAIVRARRDAEALAEIVKALDPTAHMPDPLEDTNYIPKPPFEDTMDDIARQSGQLFHFNTAATLFIRAMKANNASH